MSNIIFFLQQAYQISTNPTVFIFIILKYFFLDLQINIANFGYIPYGQSLIGTLELANPRNACAPLVYNSLNRSESNPIVVIERGGCHFVTKTHYAQIYGAKMVIIIDNQNENPNSVIMMDDGFG